MAPRHNSCRFSLPSLVRPLPRFWPKFLPLRISLVRSAGLLPSRLATSVSRASILSYSLRSAGGKEATPLALSAACRAGKMPATSFKFSGVTPPASSSFLFRPKKLFAKYVAPVISTAVSRDTPARPISSLVGPVATSSTIRMRSRSSRGIERIRISSSVSAFFRRS